MYLLLKPDGVPFYVGFGRSGRKPMDRVFLHESEARSKPRRRRNHHKLGTIRAIWAAGAEVRYSVDSWYSEDVGAKAREVALIAALGRADLDTGPLTNLTAGGDGSVELTADGQRRMLAGLKRGREGRAKWAAENPERLREMGQRIGAKAAEWARENPEAAAAQRSRAGKKGIRRTQEVIRADPLLYERWSQAAAEAGGRFARQNPEEARERGKTAYQVGMGKWAAENPELCAEARARGRAAYRERLKSNHAELSIRSQMFAESMAQWRRDNPEAVSASGKRQAARNQEKAAIRKRCLDLVARYQLSITLPSGRAGLEAWGAAMREAASLISADLAA